MDERKDEFGPESRRPLVGWGFKGKSGALITRTLGFTQRPTHPGHTLFEYGRLGGWLVNDGLSNAKP